jgi:DNA-binding GntR family transcriptional regulator
LGIAPAATNGDNRDIAGRTSVVKEIQSNRETLADKVYEEIRNAIILGDLTPGTLHSVQTLSLRLKVSRTPVREALLKLADQGMVRFERNRGARILQTSIHDLEQIFALRLLLEVPATIRAAEQIGAAELRQLSSALDTFRRTIHQADTREHLELDARFHRIIMRASGNRRLADFIDTLRDLQMMRGFSAAPKTRDLNDICDDHQLIYDQIVARNAMGAAVAMRDHLALSSRLIIAQETGDVGRADKFASPWIDFLSFQQKQSQDAQKSTVGRSKRSALAKPTPKGRSKRPSEGSGFGRRKDSIRRAAVEEFNPAPK